MDTDVLSYNEIVRRGLGPNLGILNALGKLFPYTNGSVTDLVISGADQSVVPTNGVLRYRSITFSSAHVLRIAMDRCILMVDTLVWNNAGGVIACEASAPAVTTEGAQPFTPGGAAAAATAASVGGYGGGFLIVLAGTVNGSAAGTIRANGTAGYANANLGNGLNGGGGGGALSSRLSLSNFTSQSFLEGTSEQWPGSSGSFAAGGGGLHSPIPTASMVLQPGRDSGTTDRYNGAGGGAGCGHTTQTKAGGGSGFGGGGSIGSAPAHKSRVIDPDLTAILKLWEMGCRGGGGGGAASANAAVCTGAGGGGGCVVLIVDVETQVSALQANGGAATAGGTVGGAGVTLRQVI